ncbi:MAG: DUF3781 domain-containing protein [Prevotellaceae bacterium]|jgi:hypothetical protein|nr:DUF3781 domain-containing protein [Prevotellaceae bacterium]
MQTDLISNIDKLHTTALGEERIRRNLCMDTDDAVNWCRQKIISPDSRIIRKGKNWYVYVNDCIITVNAHSYTVITAHKKTTKNLSCP